MNEALPIPLELPQDLPALQELLRQHLLAKPAMPQPYDPHSPEGCAYFAARCDWSDGLRRLKHELWKAEYPQMKFRRTQPTAASRPAPPRLRP